MSDMQEACACDNWICPHNEEKIKHLPGVVKGVAWLKGRVEEMQQYWQESEDKLSAAENELRRQSQELERAREALEDVMETDCGLMHGDDCVCCVPESGIKIEVERFFADFPAAPPRAAGERNKI